MLPTQSTFPPVPVPTEHPLAFAATGLSVELGGTQILDTLTFSIPEGNWIGLLGPNGSGKTTLLRAMGGLLPYSGQLELRGRSLSTWKDRERAREVAFVRQHASLDFDFTVGEVVALGLAPHLKWLDQPSRDQRQRVETALSDTDLTELSDRPVSSLSGGEQQRVQLAQALAQDAAILLLDEPTAHLDVHHLYDLMERVAELVRAGRTVVAAFHDLAFAARYADHLFVLDQGELAAEGPPVDVLSPELIRNVFRMEAEIETNADGIQVRYLAPV